MIVKQVQLIYSILVKESQKMQMEIRQYIQEQGPFSCSVHRAMQNIEITEEEKVTMTIIINCVTTVG